MNGRVSQYIITSLLAAALVLPGFFWGPADSPLILNKKAVIHSIIQGLPYLVLLLAISLYGSPEQRRSRGWIRPRLMDLPAILILLALTLILGKFFPADTGSYSVVLSGFGAMTLIPVLALVTALTEEVFFRSWLLSTLPAAGWPRWLAVFVSVAAFSAPHLWQGLTGMLFSALSGLIYSLWFLKYRSLFPVVAAHTIHNAMALWIAAGR